MGSVMNSFTPALICVLFSVRFSKGSALLVVPNVFLNLLRQCGLFGSRGKVQRLARCLQSFFKMSGLRICGRQCVQKSWVAKMSRLADFLGSVHGLFCLARVGFLAAKATQDEGIELIRPIGLQERCLPVLGKCLIWLPRL